MILAPLLAAALAAAPGVLHVSPAGSDAAPCTAARPCASFNRAYAEAQPGQTVEVEAGVYGDQNLLTVRKSGGGVIRFRPAAGADVTIGEVRTTGASDLEFDDLTMDDYYLAPGTHDVTFRDDHMKFFFIRDAVDVRMLGGDVGGYGEAIPATIGTLHTTDPTPRNILIDGVLFHDMTRAQNLSGHMECLFVQGVDGLIVRNSRFTHCDIFDVFFKQFEAPQYTNVRLENNFFGVATDAADPGTGGYYSLFFAYVPGADPIANVLVDHNSFAQGFHFDDAPYRNVRVVANVSVFDQGQCTSGVEWAYNVLSAARCGPTDRRGAPGFVDPSSLDLHLTSRSAALGEDRSGTAPAADIDGQQRPLRLPADAGADQRLAASLSLRGAIGAAAIGGSAARVAATYGRPRRSTTRPLAAGAPPVKVDTYGVPGGTLSVASAAGRIVGVGSRSAYFTTPGGFGVGSRGAPIGRYDACLHAFRGRRGAAVVLAAARSAGAPIGGLWLVRPPFAHGRCS